MLARCMVKMMLENVMRVYAKNPCKRVTGAAERNTRAGILYLPANTVEELKHDKFADSTHTSIII
jgi:hypothetical protein